MPVYDLSHAEILRVYGPWLARTPADAARLLDGYPGPWWIAGGWAIQAFTGVARTHADLDIGIPRNDLARLRRQLAGRLDLWAAAQENLRLLLPDDADQDELPDDCRNVWARAGGNDPWQYDVLLMDHDAGTWVFRRDPRITGPMAELTWARDGVAYLRPHIQLLFKARALRSKDQQDFDATLPLLDADDRRWLRQALDSADPGHSWLTVL